MKKAGLLLFCGALFFTACQKDPVPSKDSTLDGEAVDVSVISTSARKLFVLNEGGMGSNNATLDFLRFADGKYITNSFGKMNPSEAAGLGDVGNGIAIHGNEAWIVVNNSGIVEVISAEDEVEIAAIQVPTPRNIAFDNQYAYVTSWAGAFAKYEGYNIVDSSNPKGQLYRINLSTKKVEGSVEVGYQPEGVAVYNGKIYVANSGGISSQLPPAYSYDNTLSIIDAKTFTVEKTVDVVINMKNVYADGKGNIYMTTLGNYDDVHSGLYWIKASEPEKATLVVDRVTVSALNGDTVYCMGTEDEFNFKVSHTYTSCSVKNGAKTELSFSLENSTPYGLFAMDADTFVVSDAGDYFNPGTVTLYKGGKAKWTVTAGVCPGHFTLY